MRYSSVNGVAFPSGNFRRPSPGSEGSIAGEHVPLGDESGSFTGWRREPTSAQPSRGQTLLAMSCFPLLWPLVATIVALDLMKGMKR